MGGYTRPLRGPCSAYCGITHTHTHLFNGPLSVTTQVSRHQKGKTNLDFTEARDSEWQWYQLGRMQVCTSLQTDNHTSTPPLLENGYNGHVLPEYLPIRYNTTIFTCWCVVFWRIFHQIDGACPWVVHLCVPLSGRGILWPTCSLETVNYSVGF